jgi:hypothetical protein
MTASFNKENLGSFVSKVMTGGVRTDALPKSGFVVKKTTKWDGKDAEPIVEDNYYDDL